MNIKILPFTLIRLLIQITSIVISQPLIASSSWLAKPVSGDLDAEVTYGSRKNVVTYDTANTLNKTKSISGGEYTATLMYAPWAGIPGSFGFTAQSYSFDRSSIDQEIIHEIDPSITQTTENKVSGTTYGPTLKVWAPTPFAQPYIKLTYLTGQETSKFSTNFTVEETDLSLTGDSKEAHTATEIQLGLSTKMFGFLRLSFEVALHNGQNKLTSYSSDLTTTTTSESTSTSTSTEDLTDDDKKARNSNATSMRLGLAFFM